MDPKFVHLRLHTEFSLSDGLVRIEELIEQEVLCIAVTDQMNLFAAVKFYEAARSAGIKPILGVDCWLANLQNEKQPTRFSLLCQNQLGYQNLTRLISRAYLEGQINGVPTIDFSWLQDHALGLIVLSGAREGEIGQTLLNDNYQQAPELLQKWQQLFPGRFYLELQRTGKPNEEQYIQKVIQLAHQHQVPVVATNDVRFLSSDDFEAHEARVCIHEGYVLEDPKRPRNYTNQQYLRTSQEMQKLFSDIPESLTNTVEIAKRCNLELSLGKSYLPNFPIPDGMTAADYLKQKSQDGLTSRLAVILAKQTADTDLQTIQNTYHKRLLTELDVINNMGFAGYFLIVADFIHWAKQNAIPVGPGRGSGAGSLVAYALQITDLDPLPYDLLFERFLNPERISMPDFDIDFCMDKRDLVIAYVSERYGRDAVSQIITFGTMAAKAVIRDVGRVLAYPYGMVDKLAKLIPFEIGITLQKALKQEDELKNRYEQEDDVRTLIDLALKLEGLTRNVGKHAAGVVIAPSKLTDFTPLYCEAGGGDLVTQFDMEDIQTAGLVKFDFLGLRTLTIIDWALQTINTKRRTQNLPDLDINHIPINDTKTFALLKAYATTAIFQLESRGMRDLVKRLQPDTFEDIIALVALFRPGPLQSGMVEDFINRKHGKAAIEYLHPLLEPILGATYGIIVYQEQVMQIAQVLAGYTLGGADLLRRAMGKKKAEEMAKHREIFVAGATTRNVDARIATNIFDLMEMFADYGFNKSHSAAYALVSYQTAWLKAHYPSEFMAAVLSSDMDNTDKVVALLTECQSMKLKVLPPNINQSQYQFTVDEDGSIIFGLGAIKGAGESAIENIIINRKQQGLFKDILDFCCRIDTRKVNKRVLEALVRSGSLDSLGKNRATLFNSLNSAVQAADQHTQNNNKQKDLFGATSVQQITIADEEEWSDEIRLQGEKATLGFYLSGHPLQRYENELKQIAPTSLIELTNSRQNKSVTIAGWVANIKVLYTKRGDRMGVILLEDHSGKIELTIFSDTFTTYKDLLNKDQLLIAQGEITIDEFTGNQRIIAKKIFDITTAREQFGGEIIIQVAAAQLSPSFIDNLRQILTPYVDGYCPIAIHYQKDDSKAMLYLGEKWRVKPTDDLIKDLNKFLSNNAVVVNYTRE